VGCGDRHVHGQEGARLTPRTLVVAWLCLTPLTAQAQRFTAQVVAVHDGDTISVRTETQTLKVRVIGVDCPEFGQPYSSRAKQFTSQLVFGKTVTIESHGADQYGRTLAHVFLNSQDLGEELLRAGMAWRYEIGPADQRLIDAEGAARRSRAGLWAESAPVPPWQWRHQRQDDAGSSGSAGSTSNGSRTARVDLRDARGPFHGNVRSHIYHRPGCPNYNCKSCEEAFLTTQSAEEAGYTPAGDCLRAAP
jgi:endonuclease YncB( thermonuclease family)